MTQSTMTQRPATPSTKKKGCGCGCGGHEHKPSCQPCCTEVCFERPSYFCGHLLSDDDLNTEQRYFREKNKLYHRTLHGDGIVCGLRLTRDLECPGQIIIGEGFAIDACGNDLVVCQPTPYNVIHALREKGFLVQDAPADPCAGTKDDDDCSTTQCFYIAACYDEQQTDFESPLQNACSPGPASCEATRIHETVKFQVLDSLPTEKSILDRLTDLLTCCLRVLNEGAFGSTMKANASVIADLFDGQATASTDYFNIFCQLKVYFLQHIKKCPDLYDATLEPDVKALSCPAKPAQGPGGLDFVPTETAFCEFFACVLRYINDCILGQLIFSCPAPTNSGEVILGSVEIKNGRLAHICFCARKYVWSAANFWQVLITTLLEQAACHPARAATFRTNEGAGTLTPANPRKEQSNGCCPDFAVNCRTFVALYEASPEALNTHVMAPLNLVKTLAGGLQTALNLFDPNTVSANVFNGLDRKVATVLAQKVNVDLQITTDAPVSTYSTPLAASFVNLLAHPGDQITAVDGQNGLVVTPFATVSTALAQRDRTISELQTTLAGLNDRLAKLESAAAAPPAAGKEVQ